MFFHALAGCLVFMIFAIVSGKTPSWQFMALGVVVAYLPDWPYVIECLARLCLRKKLPINKYAHEHRDGIMHSLFFPPLMLLLAWFVMPEYKLPVFFAVASHPLLDLWGIGWGVKLFYPFSEKTFKLFFQGKWIVALSPQELETIVEQKGDDEWLRKVYIDFNSPDLFWWYGPVDLATGAITLSLIFSTKVIWG